MGALPIVIFLQLRSKLLVVTALSNVILALDSHSLYTQWHVLDLGLELNSLHVDVLELITILTLVVFQHLCF